MSANERKYREDCHQDYVMETWEKNHCWNHVLKVYGLILRMFAVFGKVSCHDDDCPELETREVWYFIKCSPDLNYSMETLLHLVIMVHSIPWYDWIICCKMRIAFASNAIVLLSFLLTCVELKSKSFQKQAFQTGIFFIGYPRSSHLTA